MNLVACPQCGARFDVSSMTPGSTFVCGSCENMLQVPGGSAAPKPRAPKPPPARPGGIGPGAGSGRRTDPRRAGGGVPAPGPSARSAPSAPAGGRSAPSGRRAPRRTSEGTEKSNLPLVLGGVGGLVVIIGIVAAIALSGGGGESGGGTGGGPAGVSGPGTPEGGGTGDPVAKSEQHRLALLGARTIQDLERVYAHAKSDGVMDIAKKAAEAALERDETLEWANLGVGRKNLSPVMDEYTGILEANPDVGTYGNQAVRDLEELLGEVEWGTPAQFDRAQALLAEVREHSRKLETDRSYGDLVRTKVWIRAHAVYGDYDYVVEYRKPYVIAVQHHGQQEGVARQIADRNAKILQHLYKEFHRVFDKAFQLPDLAGRERADERILKVFTFIDEKSFRKYQEIIRQPLPPGARAYYYPPDQWITLFEGQGFEKRAAEGESDFNTNKIFHEGTHQLLHSYTKILMERDGGEEVAWEDDRTSSRAHWFQEGFAELMGSSKPRADGLWDLMVASRNRSKEWVDARKANEPEWSLEELLRIRDGRAMQTEARRKALAGANKLTSLFYAQAWSFNHFLWHHENGKYRDKLIAYLGKELHGVSGYDEWKEVWGKTDDDWSGLEREWRASFEKVCAELGVK